MANEKEKSAQLIERGFWITFQCVHSKGVHYFDLHFDNWDVYKIPVCKSHDNGQIMPKNTRYDIIS